MLGITLILEGSGFKGGREISYYIILSMPLLVLIPVLICKKHIEIPLAISVVYLFFIFSVAIASIFSLDILRSFKQLLYTIALFLIFHIVFDQRRSIGKYIYSFLFGSSVYFIVYSFFLVSFFRDNVFLVPKHGYQFVYSRFGSHLHLGDYLLNPTLIIYYRFLKYKFNYFIVSLLLIFLSLIVLSFSRTAYVSAVFGLIGIYYLLLNKSGNEKRIFKKVFTFLIVMLIILFFFSVAQQAEQIQIVSNVHNFLEDYADLGTKDFLTRRYFFIKDAIYSIINFPFFGIGPGNYVYISGLAAPVQRFATYSSHNIFLDVFVENGIVGGILFLLLLAKIFTKANKSSILFMIIIAFLINFMADYTFKIFSLYLLFTILLALIIAEGKTYTLNKVTIILVFIASIILFLAGNILLFTNELPLH